MRALSLCINQPAWSHSIPLCSYPGCLPALSMYLWLQGSTNSSRMHPNLSLHNLLLFQSWGSHIFSQNLLIMPWSILLFSRSKPAFHKITHFLKDLLPMASEQSFHLVVVFLPGPHHMPRASFHGGIIMCTCSEEIILRPSVCRSP